MGLNASKRVERVLSSSPEFDAACEAVYDRCLSEAQHAFPCVRRYQLVEAAAGLYGLISGDITLVGRWVPKPPGRAQVDATIRRVLPGASDDLAWAEFRAFAVDLFRDAVLAGAGRAVLRGVPIGVAGIAGLGVATRAGGEVIARIMGVYAVGITAAVYLSLS
ncbi:uncharacterized protein LOC122019268 [Zingiber officinale]|uniref:Uncharacterized protein n=1 Tax=Zingiber officinale TaxID=94328 RepID=A0A8J5F581_ZINOF|nr:uncharacterized protein LOC122019268 [Zingiber officinale]KAG6479266.1 hypothetical protein ZIOFF_062728 [Zingiber officinale]